MRISTCQLCPVIVNSDGEEEEDCDDDDDDMTFMMMLFYVSKPPVGAVQSMLVIRITMMIMSVCRCGLVGSCDRAEPSGSSHTQAQSQVRGKHAWK